jgi:hypothetical protein
MALMGRILVGLLMELLEIMMGMLLGLQRRQLQCIHNMSHTRDIRSINPTKVTAIMPHTNPILVALGAQ